MKHLVLYARMKTMQDLFIGSDPFRAMCPKASKTTANPAKMAAIIT